MAALGLQQMHGSRKEATGSHPRIKNGEWRQKPPANHDPCLSSLTYTSEEGSALCTEWALSLLTGLRRAQRQCILPHPGCQPEHSPLSRLAPRAWPPSAPPHHSVPRHAEEAQRYPPPATPGKRCTYTLAGTPTVIKVIAQKRAETAQTCQRFPLKASTF